MCLCLVFLALIVSVLWDSQAVWCSDALDTMNLNQNQNHLVPITHNKCERLRFGRMGRNRSAYVFHSSVDQNYHISDSM